MSHFSAKKLFFTLTGLTVALLFNSIAFAEDITAKDFLGFWEIQESAGDTCVVIIKRGNRVSCFWSKTANTQIQQGSWRMDGEKLVTTWDSGYIDVFEKIGTNAISRSSYNPQSDISGTPTNSVRGVRVDNRVPGSLTTGSDDFQPRAREVIDPQDTSVIPMRNAYIGYWKVKQSTGIFGIGGASSEFFYLNLDRTGVASVALRNWDGTDSITGKWRIENDDVFIEWEDGHKDILTEINSNGYGLKTFGKKKNFSDKPTDSKKAEKVIASEAQQYFTAGNLQKLTTADIRGTWSSKTPSENTEYIEIEGWGNAYRFPSSVNGDGTDPGKWRLSNDRVVITWVDGSKDVIRLGFPNFIRDSYAPGEPTNGTPYKTKEVIRVEKHL